jgi:hypothetical protein
VTSPKGTIGSAGQRLALTYYVVALVFEEDVANRGGSVTSADRDSAEQQVQSEEQQGATYGGTERKVLLRLSAAQAAFVRLANTSTSDVSDADIKAYFDSHPEEFGEITCIDGFAVLEDNKAAAQSAIDAGKTADEILADASLSPEPLQQGGGQVCVPKGQVQAEALATLVDDGAIGVWGSTTVQGQDGTSRTVFIRPATRGPASLSDSSVVDQIKQTLEQQATTEAQSKVAAEQKKLLARAKVEIDPQYGTWDPRDTATLIAPPATPKDPSTTTLPALTSSGGA